MVDGGGAIVFTARLARDAKVEGIVAIDRGARTTLAMVTDADDPFVPASLLVAQLTD